MKAKGKGYTRAYPPNEADRRTHDHVVECGERAIEDRVTHVFGVKTVSPLILLNPSTGFDMVNSFPVDYMHCVLLGVTKQLLDLWFNSKHHKSHWYIGTSKDQVDQRLLSIKPPSDVPRVPRTMKGKEVDGIVLLGCPHQKLRARRKSYFVFLFVMYLKMTMLLLSSMREQS